MPHVGVKNQYLEDLVRRICALEDKAFQEFADYFGTRLKKRFFRSGLSLSESEDFAATCVGDIALKATKYKQTSQGSFHAWVFTLAQNALTDWRKAQIPTLSLEDDRFVQEEQEGFLSLWEETEETETNTLKEEAKAAVREAVAALSESDQKIIQFRNVEEPQPYEEIAQVVGITANAARQRHNRAMERLEKKLCMDPRIQSFLKSK